MPSEKEEKEDGFKNRDAKGLMMKQSRSSDEAKERAKEHERSNLSRVPSKYVTIGTRFERCP